jgi:periplasmic protein TonB
VRCCECEIEPLTPGHFCECCGRKLSLQERKALETTTVAPEAVHAAHSSPDHDRLVGIHFTGQPVVDPVPVVDENPTAVRPVVDSFLEAHFAGHAPVESQAAVPTPERTRAADASVWSAPSVHVAAQDSGPVPFVDVSTEHVDRHVPAGGCEICGQPAHGENLCAACQQIYQCLLGNKTPAHAEAAVVASVALAPEKTLDVVPAPTVVMTHAVVVAPPVVIAPDLSAASHMPVEPMSVISVRPSPAPQPAAAEALSVPKKPRPVRPIVAAAVPGSKQPSSARTIAAAGLVVVVVAALGFPLGKLWLGHQEATPIVREEAPIAPVNDAAAPAMTPPRVVPASTTARAESDVSAPPKAAPATPPPSPAGVAQRTAAGRVPSKTTAKPNPSARPAAVVAAPSAAAVAPALEIAAPAPVVVAAPKPEAPVAPVGPFFELRDVNETPRIASRVEPQLPDDLRDRPLNEVVIVRVLVTQAGQPAIVNLLRRSKAGPSLDDSIVAAVKQWKFVPARKRGEAVSCWYHVGVPIVKAH